MTTLIGSSTAIVRGAIAFRCSRTQNSSRLYSTRFSARATPMREQKSRMASGVYPRRRIPQMVGIRGSSQPRTNPPFTSWMSLRLDSTV